MGLDATLYYEGDKDSGKLMKLIRPDVRISETNENNKSLA